MSESPMTMKWFTRVRRIPTLIGKMPSGERIKGGPYKASQLVAFGSVLVVSLWSMKWWAQLPVYSTGVDGQFYAYATAGVAAVGAGLIAKRTTPTEGQSAVATGSGAARLLTSSRDPRFGQGSAVPRATRRPARRVRITITEAPAAEVRLPSLADPIEAPSTAPQSPQTAPSSAQQKLTALLATNATNTPGARS